MALLPTRYKGLVGPSYTLPNYNYDCQRTVNRYVEYDEMGTGKSEEPAQLVNFPGLTTILTTAGNTVAQNPTVQYLVVAGGGGGGGAAGAPYYYYYGGGGGAGGFLTGSTTVTKNTPITITVGLGGAMQANGSNSVFGNIVAIGGGAGGISNGGTVTDGQAGGSGGGGGGFSLEGLNGNPGLGTAGQGYNGAPTAGGGGQGGGGGGAGGVGGSSSTNPMASGLPAYSSITGTNTAYGLGGESGDFNNQNPGTPNTGNGGNGGYGQAGTAGGSGVVIIAYPLANGLATTTGTVTRSIVGTNYVYTFVSNGTISIPPSLTETVIGESRNGWVCSNNEMYWTFGPSLFVISGNPYDTQNWSARYIGSIDGVGEVQYADNGIQLFIVTSTGNTWILDLVSQNLWLAGTGANDSDGWQLASSVTYFDGYVVFSQLNSNQFFWTDLYSTSVNGLNFAAAETNPDHIIKVLANGETLWVFGQNVTELWYDQGSGNYVFARIPQTLMETGAASPNTIEKINSYIIWLATDQRGGPIVMMTNSNNPLRVSNFGVEYIMQQYSEAQIQGATADSYQWNGHFFYQLNIPGMDTTLVFDLTSYQQSGKATWVEKQSGVGYNTTRSIAEGHAYYMGHHITGDRSTSGNLYFYDESNPTENGSPMARIRTFPHISNNLTRVKHRSLQLDYLVGTVNGTSTQPVWVLGPETTTGTVNFGSETAAQAFINAEIANILQDWPSAQVNGNSVTYGPGLSQNFTIRIVLPPTTQLVACPAGSQYIWKSNDSGVTWTWSTLSFTLQGTNGVGAYNGVSTYVFAQYGSPYMCVSTDNGDTWQQYNAGGDGSWWSVAWNGTTFASVGRDGWVATSPDGITWTTHGAPLNSFGSPWHNLYFGNGLFVVFDEGNHVATSTDGVTWGVANVVGGSTAIANMVVGWTGTHWTIAVGNYAGYWADTYTSLDLVTWTPVQTIGDGISYNSAFNGLNIVTSPGSSSTGSNQSILVDSAGHITYGVLPTLSHWDCITWNGAVYCAIGHDGIGGARVATSTNGINWTDHGNPFGYNAIPLSIVGSSLNIPDAYYVDTSGIQYILTTESSDPQISLQYSDDGGATWSNEVFESLGKSGEYLTRVIFYDLGMARNRVYKITESNNCYTGLSGGVINIELGNT